MRVTLRPYQATALDSVRAAFASGKRAPLLCSPCGSGKTVMFAHITEGATAKGNRVLILVHRQELLRQTSLALDGLGVQHGLISPQYKHTTDPVQVASVQTLVRRLHKEPAPDLIVVDECSHAVAGSWAKVFAAYPRARLLGCTATPSRLDNRGLGDVFDSLILGPSVKKLIELVYLSRPVYYNLDAHVDAIRHRAGEFDAAAAAAAMDKGKIYGNVISNYRRICDGKPSIAFCATVQHAQRTAEQFAAAGYKAAAVHGDTDDLTRRNMFRDIANGSLNLLANCEIAGEGTDIKSLFAVLLLRHTESTALHLQQCGRPMRPYPGKPYCAILDFVGNYLRHGFPEDDRDWTLDGTKQGKPKNDGDVVQRMKTCMLCYGMNPVWRQTCEQCGAAFEAHRPLPAQVEGELVEITDAQKEAMRISKRREEGRAQSLEDFQKLAAARGYAPAWARIRWGLRQRRAAA